MPIYDYICSNCATRTEVIHGINAPAPRFCPACGADGTLRKAFVAPTVVFKGSGWAKKDRASSAGTRTKAGGGSDGKDATRESGGSSESGGSGGSGESGNKSKGEASTDPSSTSPAAGTGSSASHES
jgi:putative FmdB family regulatory protein